MNYNLTPGINLDDRTIYFNIPDNTTISEFKKIVETDKADNYIAEDLSSGVSRGYYHYVNEDNQEVFGIFYNSTDTNLQSIKLPENFGTITKIDDTSVLYQYISRTSHEKVYVISEDFAKQESMGKDDIIAEVEEKVRGYGVPVNSVFNFDGIEIPEGYEEIEDDCEFIFPKFMANAKSGDANLIKYKKNVILIDSYHSDQWIDIKAMLDDNQVTHIDYFILTHYHVDHYGNFKNLVENNYIDENTNLYMPSELTQIGWVNTLIQEYSNYCSEHNLTYYVPEENEILIIGDLKLTFYNTNPTILYQKYYENIANPDYNNTSTVILLEFKKVSSLFVGDCCKLAFQRLREDKFVKGKINFYKIGHHGVNNPTDIEFIKGISPDFAVLPSGIRDYVVNNLSISTEVYILRENNTKVYPQHMQPEYIKFISDGSSINCIFGKPYNPAVWSITYDIYVDKEASTSSIQDGTQEHPYSEIMQAINSINTTYNCEINLYLADGVYGKPHPIEPNKNRIFIRTGRKARLNIYGNSQDRTAVSLTGCQIENSCVKFTNLTIDIDYSSYVGGGIYSYNSDIFLDNVLVDSLTNSPNNNNPCVKGAYNSNITIFNNSKLNNGKYGIQMFGGSLFLENIRFGTFTTGVLSLDRTPYYTANLAFDNNSDKIGFKYHELIENPKLLFNGQRNDEVVCYDNLSNYDWIEIFGTTNDNIPFSSGRIWNPSSRKISLNASFVTAAGGYITKSCLATISDDTITLSRQSNFNIASDGTITVGTAGYLDIRRIVGGKADFIDIR